MYPVLALQRVNLMEAVKLGTRLAQPRKSSDPTLEQLLDQQLNEAYPKD